MSIRTYLPGRATLSLEQVAAIRARYPDETMAAIAADFGVSLENVRAIVSNHTWHDPEYVVRKRPRGRPGWASGKANGHKAKGHSANGHSNGAVNGAAQPAAPLINFVRRY
jgi:hypothetical protein